MKRFKRHKVKSEMPETSTSHNREQEEHDLAYYIHDRVELMHQVFSVLKHKELKAMAPTCIRNISIDDLQELCTEELLGISSKRLCAILDGAEAPSDTESSSQSATEQLETISLDSISSDEELLSQEDKSKKKKHKHRRRDSKSKSKHKKSKDVGNDQEAEQSKASRAGLTVLELLELQARARAIRAQLQQEQTVQASDVAAGSTHKSPSDEDDVEIKEEPAEVVEISSDEEKPKIEELEKSNLQVKSPEPPSKTVTKRVNDLIITVPQAKTQKIKLKRKISVPQEVNKTTQSKETLEKPVEKVTKDIPKEKTKIDKPKDAKSKDAKSKDNAKKDKIKDKSKKKKQKKLSSANASDNDEITLQLSDTEKMDLLEDLDRKNYDNVSSDTSSDSESDKEDSKKATHKHTSVPNEDTSGNVGKSRDKINVREKRISREGRKSKDQVDSNPVVEANIETKNIEHGVEDSQHIEEDSVEIKESNYVENENLNSVAENGDSQNTSRTDSENVDESKFETEDNDAETVQSDDPTTQTNKEESEVTYENGDEDEKSSLKIDETTVSQDTVDSITKENEKVMSEGELSDKESSEVEAFDLKPEVVCISDEEEAKTRKKKKKKEKKSKKDKKNKKKDFRESGDQNYHSIFDNSANSSIKVLVTFPTEGETIKKVMNDASSAQEIEKETEESKLQSTIEIDLITPEKTQDSILDTNNLEPAAAIQNPEENPSDIDSRNVDDESPYEVVEISDEVYELSDDSSNDYEAETNNVLSKEPTASEIEALSAKIDEIERVDVITEDEINKYEAKHKDEEEEVAISWKDRYLDSKKVKRVLNTSNILNALRKKNRELKKRLEESKVETQDNVQDVQVVEDGQDETRDSEIPEGSIEHYNTLEGSTKFVDPIKETPITDTLKKDAKQLLKMYKKLLKYNDMTRKKDPTKKKKKKKSKKEKEKVGDSVVDKTNT